MPADAILFATESNQEVWEMNSRFQKVLRGSLFTALMALFLMLPGCPLVEAGGLVAGSAYEVEIQVLEDGTLYAVSIEPSDEGEQDGEQEGENEEEDGENEDEDGEGDEVETGFSVQVDSIAADCSSFTVFGSLTVVLEADDAAGEDLEREAGEEEIGICDLTAGMWIEVEGEYGADGVFVAEEIEIADEAETEIESVLENLTGGTFTMLGLTISYDSDTVIEASEEEEDGEGDDDDCEQEGENEGENAGC